MDDLTLCEKIVRKIDYASFSLNIILETRENNKRVGVKPPPRWSKVLHRLLSNKSDEERFDWVLLPYALAKTVYCGNEGAIEKGLDAVEYCFELSQRIARFTDPETKLLFIRRMALACLLYDAIEYGFESPDLTLNPRKNLILKVLSKHHSHGLADIVWELLYRCTIVRHNYGSESSRKMDHPIHQPMLDVVVDCTMLSELGVGGIRWLMVSNYHDRSFDWRFVVDWFYLHLVYFPAKMNTEHFKKVRGMEKLKEMLEIVEQAMTDLMRRFPIRDGPATSEDDLKKILEFNQRLKNYDSYCEIKIEESHEIYKLVSYWVDEKRWRSWVRYFGN